jgi:hypothetical protein
LGHGTCISVIFSQLCEVVAGGIIHIDDLANLNHKQDIKLRTLEYPSVFLETYWRVLYSLEKKKKTLVKIRTPKK